MNLKYYITYWLDYLWDSALFVNDNTLTVNITRIRNKMEELGIKDYIKTKRGQGYMIWVYKSI